MNKNIIIISINRKMPIKILTSNNRIIIKENFAHFSNNSERDLLHWNDYLKNQDIPMNEWMMARIRKMTKEGLTMFLLWLTVQVIWRVVRRFDLYSCWCTHCTVKRSVWFGRAWFYGKRRHGVTRKSHPPHSTFCI